MKPSISVSYPPKKVHFEVFFPWHFLQVGQAYMRDDVALSVANYVKLVWPTQHLIVVFQRFQMFGKAQKGWEVLFTHHTHTMIHACIYCIYTVYIYIYIYNICT